jgi:hypothetical protein
VSSSVPPRPRTEADIIVCLELGRQAGYNEIDAWGLFATGAYPIDIRSAFRDPERRPRVKRIQRCLVSAIADVETLALGKGEAL